MSRSQDCESIPPGAALDAQVSFVRAAVDSPVEMGAPRIPVNSDSGVHSLELGDDVLEGCAVLVRQIHIAQVI